VAGSAELAEIVVTASLPSAVGAGTVAAGTVAAGAAASALASGGGSAAGNTLEEITVTPKPLPPPAALIPASVVQAAAVAATAALPALVSAPATPTPQPQPQPQPQNQLLNSAADAAGKILSNTAVKVGTTLLTGAILGTGSSTHPSAPPPQAPGMAPVVDSNGNIIGSAPIPAGQPGSLQNPSVFSTVPLWVWLVGAAVILR
jgi:hypothetical protein